MPVSSLGRPGPRTLRRPPRPELTRTTAIIAAMATVTTISHAFRPGRCRGRRQPQRQRHGSRSGPNLIVSTDLDTVPSARVPPGAPIFLTPWHAELLL